MDLNYFVCVTRHWLNHYDILSSSVALDEIRGYNEKLRVKRELNEFSVIKTER